MGIDKSTKIDHFEKLCIQFASCYWYWPKISLQIPKKVLQITQKIKNGVWGMELGNKSRKQGKLIYTQTSLFYFKSYIQYTGLCFRWTCSLLNWNLKHSRNVTGNNWWGNSAWSGSSRSWRLGRFGTATCWRMRPLLRTSSILLRVRWHSRSSWNRWLLFHLARIFINQTCTEMRNRERLPFLLKTGSFLNTSILEKSLLDAWYTFRCYEPYLPYYCVKNCIEIFELPVYILNEEKCVQMFL